MFETHARAITRSPYDYDKGLLALDFVSQRFHAEWFYINQNIRTDLGEISSRMLMIDDPNELKALLISRTRSAWVQDIYLVTPGSVNKTGTWAIDLLLEMKEFATATEHGNKGFAYKIHGNSSQYFSSETGDTWEELPCKIVYLRKPVSNFNPRNYGANE
ncbi:TPA: hypothetical protein U8251_002855 [Pseudomonas putida]|nr:hypothetical protein [Pseudomonas putida]